MITLIKKYFHTQKDIIYSEYKPQINKENFKHVTKNNISYVSELQSNFEKNKNNEDLQYNIKMENTTVTTL